MITFQEAQKLVLENTPILPAEEKNISKIFSQILAEDIEAEVAIPSFSNSAMDGFAVRSADTKSEGCILKVVACIKAGDFPFVKIRRGETAKIMTGAPLPDGADAVIMKEHAEEKDGGVILRKAVRKGENIRYEGEEIKKGQTALKRGQILNPAALGFLISLGRKEIKVNRNPVVSVLVTGNELREPGSRLEPGQIWESNSVLLGAALYEVGIKPRFLGIAKDKVEDLAVRLEQGLDCSDVLIVCGGISVGDYDLVQKVLEKFEIKKIFWRVAIKPGKPTYFGKKKASLFLDFPGIQLLCW